MTKTLSGKPFRYVVAPTGELIAYPSDSNRQPQDKFALVVTPYVIQFVKHEITRRSEILMGASRDDPPANSLGALLRQEGQTPQQLSYLVPVLIDQGFCEYEKDGRAFWQFPSWRANLCHDQAFTSGVIRLPFGPL